MTFAMRQRPDNVARLQHLAGLAWKEGNIDEAERLEELARTLDIHAHQGKPQMTRHYNSAPPRRTPAVLPDNQ